MWLESNLPLPVLKTLTELNIYETGRTITHEEITCILEYSAECKNLRQVRLVKCLLPKKVEVKSSRTLLKQGTEVWWGPRGGFSDYCLNIFTGQWEVSRVPDSSSVRPLSERPEIRPMSENVVDKHSKTTVMTDEIYQRVVEKIAFYRTQMEYPEEYASNLDNE